MTSTHVSMHPTKSSLNSSDFLKVFLDLPPHLLLESLFLVAKASSVLFIISQSWHPVPRYCSSWNPLDHSSYLQFHSSLLSCPPPPGTVLATSRVGGNGVDSCLFRCGSTKSTLLPCARFVTRLSCVIEFLKIEYSLNFMAHELSA